MDITILNTEQKHIVILAGGVGDRFQNLVHKQFNLLKGKPVLLHTLTTYYRSSLGFKITLVLNEAHLPIWEKICVDYNVTIPFRIVFGGKERFHSVKNAIRDIDDSSLIGIHDGVRPLVSQDVIFRVYKQASVSGAAVPVVSAINTIRKQSVGLFTAVDRKDIYEVQNPQVFRGGLLKKAYRQNFQQDFYDDATVVENWGHNIEVVEGNRENIKITHEIDMKIAGALLREPADFGIY